MTTPPGMFDPVSAAKCVNHYWFRHCYDMAMNEPMIRACLTLLEKCVRFKEMKFVGVRANSALDRSLHEIFDELSPHIMKAVFMWGLVPILLRPRRWDAAWDKEFVETAKAGKLELNVPLIPTFGTYKVEIVVDPDDMQQRFRAFSEIPTDIGHPPPLYVVEGGNLSPPPRFDTGGLRSVIHSMSASYNALVQREAFATFAEYTRSGPPVALQQSDKVDGLLSGKMSEREFGRSAMQIGENKMMYQTRSANMEELRKTQDNLRDQMKSEATTRSAYFTDPLNIMDKPLELTHPLISQTVPIPPGMEVSSTQPTLPIPPDDMEERHQRHFLIMCDAFQIPVSLFAYARKDGVVREITDSDQAMLSGTMRRVCDELTRVLMRIIRLMGLGEDAVKDLEFSPVTYVNVEMLKELFLAGAMDPEEFSRIVETSSGLKIKTREPKELEAKVESAKASTVAAKSTAEVAKITATAAARETTSSSSSSSSSSKRAKKS